MTETFEFTGFGTLAENIEERILDSIRKGISSGEPHALRPLREVFQNCDDELADRFFIRIDKDALYFLNDGHRLTVEYNKDDKPIGGTTRMITGIAMASKRKDRGRAGEFGTGLRSAHAISHRIEVTGKIERYDHVGENEKKERIFQLSNKQTTDFYTGQSNAYDKTLVEKMIDITPFHTRDTKDRPPRGFFPETTIPRDGIMIRLPWRYEIEPGSNDRDEWVDYTWDKERIQAISKLYEEQIPLILLGCSWLREVVLEIDFSGEKKVLAWQRDFNQRQITSDGITDVQLRYLSLQNETIGVKDGLKFPLSKLNILKEEEFAILTALNLDLDSIAENADLLSSLHILIPQNPSKELPAYTPIALVGNSGNSFGVTAYLPPDDSRTRIKIDGVKRTRQLWAGHAMIRFSEQILPNLLKYTLNNFKDEPIKILRLLPRSSPDFWFTEGKGMGTAYSHDSSARDRELSRQIDTAWHNMSLSWKKYRQYVEDAPIFPTKSGNWISATEVVRVNVNQPKKEEIVRKILEKLGETVVSQAQYEELSKLNQECWKESNPLENMIQINSVIDLNNILMKHSSVLNLNFLGKELVEQLYSLVHVEPPEKWEDDEANRKKTPCIPNADGNLLPLLNSHNRMNFFPDSDAFPDLIPSSRRIHNDFSKQVKSLNLNQPDSEELALLVNEAAILSPKIFDNLHEHPDVHKQVSLALVKICEGALTQNMRDAKFIPCMHKGKIITREMGRVGEEHVWPIDSIGNATRTSYQSRDMILFDEREKRATLSLHQIILDNLVWLDLHEDAESHLPVIRDAMKGNIATSVNPGVNIIRSLVFALPVPQTNHRYESVFHIHDDGTHELDKWIGTKLETDVRNEVLDSLLELLRRAANKNEHNGMSTGWGADSRERVRNLKLLRDENEEWSNLGDLCFDLRSDLSQLFEKRAVSSTHRDILGVDVITKPVGQANGAGLGITQRIGELEIIDLLNTLHASKNEIRSKIISMMLSSNEEWILSESNLQEIEWIPTVDGQYKKFSDVILPTDEIVSLLGDSHPYYLICDIDLNTLSVKNRANELNMQVEISRVANMASALLQPDAVWSGLNGLEILQHLSKIYAENPTMPKDITEFRKNRLPDARGRWHDDSWLVSPSIIEDAKLLYPEKNIVTSSEIGGVAIEGMATDWLLAQNMGPTVEILIEKLIELSLDDNENLERIQSVWRLLIETYNETGDAGLDWPDRNVCLNLKFPIDNVAVRLSNVFLTSDDTEQLLYSDTFFGVDENSESANLLQKFKVTNLEDITPQEFSQSKKDLEDSEFTQNSVERYWITLASLRRTHIESILRTDCWLYKDQSGFNFTSLKNNAHERKALIPDAQDSLNDLTRMIKENCGFIWLPREGPCQEKIYQHLLEHDLPFMSTVAMEKVIDSGEIEMKKWDFITQAINNILQATSIIPDISRYSDYRAEVYQTSEVLTSDLFVRTRIGSPQVLWKKSPAVKPIITQTDHEEKLIKMIISSNTNSVLNDTLLSDALIRIIANARSVKSVKTIQRLVQYPEELWSTIHPELDISMHDWKNIPRELISTGIHSEFAAELESTYGGCQICGRRTPANRRGDSQESVVSLFKQHGGKYFSDSIGYTQGNVMYLCPIHKALYQRSKFENLMWIPDLDDMIKRIEETQDQNLPEQIVSNMLDSLEKSEQITLRVMTYEKEREMESANEIAWQVTWKKNHASGFINAVTKYLNGLIR